MRRDKDDEFSLLISVLSVTEKIAEQGDFLQQRNARFGPANVASDQTPQRDGLAVLDRNRACST